jgi:hypothetical protein
MKLSLLDKIKYKLCDVTGHKYSMCFFCKMTLHQKIQFVIKVVTAVVITKIISDAIDGAFKKEGDNGKNNNTGHRDGFSRCD